MSRERRFKFPRIRLTAVLTLAGGLWGATLSAEPGEKAAVNDAIASAATAAMIWLRQGIGPCMNAANGGTDPKPEKKKPTEMKLREPKPGQPAHDTPSKDS